jgi:hypothetical protein
MKRHDLGDVSQTGDFFKLLRVTWVLQELQNSA